MTRKPRTLRRRLTLWMCGTSLAVMAVFTLAAYVVIHYEEEEDEAEAETGTHVPEDPSESARDQVFTALAIAAPICVLLSVVAAAWTSRRVSAPIDHAIDTASAISVDRLDDRMPIDVELAELNALALAVNDLLDRLQRGYVALAAFSADASHELRTPLAAVSNELEVALRRPRSPEEWETSARTSLAQLRRLSSVVDAMLRFAQADTAPDGDDATEVDLADVIETVAAANQHAADRGELTLRVELPAGEPAERVRGGEDLLATALANLVTNAIRLTPRGGEIAISLAATANGGATGGATGELAIHVDDTGPGLPADRSTLFVPFAKGAARDGGIGLGLAITRRIVERHGGRIAADNRAGGGARFTISLPTASARRAG